MLERSLTRVLVGLVLLSNGVNVAFLIASGRAGEAPWWSTAATPPTWPTRCRRRSS